MYDNIGNPFEQNVRAAGEAIAQGALDTDERVIVFHRGYGIPDVEGIRSVVYELVKDSSQPNGFRREILKVYDSGVNTSFLPEVLERVVGDIRRAVPANHYGFAFGSHGFGWLPKDSPPYSRTGVSADGSEQHPWAEIWTIPENPLTRFLASERGERLNIAEFMDGIDEWDWDFLLMDDCFMASVEVMYQMRDVADYFIVSPTEIMIDGFPYDKVVPALFADWDADIERALSNVAADFVEAYRTEAIGDRPSATIAVVKSAEMANLAEAIRQLRLVENEMTSANEVAGLQHYDGLTQPGHLFYDLDHYISTIRGSVTPTEYNAYKTQLGRTVIFKDHTDRFFSGWPRPYGSLHPIDENHFSGLAVFIPWSETSSFVSAYQQTDWYKYVYAQQ
jgi:hypothetical protein